MKGVPNMPLNIVVCMKVVPKPEEVKVDPETNVRDVVELMLLHRVGAVPVADLDTGDLLGIVSYIDLLRVLQETLEPGA